ncbi:hypothetical protein GYMLUDRAFT_375475 [Collybiopsis luxurians FD-317 M1]|uniref:Uncharacterized protein n=1 Tax=Collybiopsis luxurians FD-317 M1 TaxID=944289 RepID=A0A0D0CB13_9AGAR|nr:hypothetical protein GYMLUDRAFT_375475 [Collybiopsis luxurians FD-317 M1]
MQSRQSGPAPGSCNGLRIRSAFRSHHAACYKLIYSSTHLYHLLFPILPQRTEQQRRQWNPRRRVLTPRHWISIQQIEPEDLDRPHDIFFFGICVSDKA